MKLVDRTGGYYLFWTGAVYLTVGLSLIPLGLTSYSEFIAPVWILVLALPFVIPPFGRWLNMSIEWDIKMFNWFKGKTAKEYLDGSKADSNVVKFPETPKVPYIVPPAPAPEAPAKIFYRLGVTDNNRVAFSMGMSEITMTKVGCQQMIEQLEVFMGQLHDGEEDADEE